MNQCKICGSFAINHHSHGRDGSDPDLCDVCYWRKRAKKASIVEKKDGWIVGVCFDTLRGWFERDSDGTGGNLEFSAQKELDDYDGVFALPTPVVKILQSLKITVPSSCCEHDGDGDGE